MPSQTLLFACSALLVGACTGGGVPARDISDAIELEVGPDEVVFQLGSYDIGENIDSFVTGPRLVVYGDGSVYRDEYDDPDTELRRARFDDETLLDLVAAGRELPAVGSIEDVLCAEDQTPTKLVIERQTWSACDLIDMDGFGSFIRSVRVEFDSAETLEWVPGAWVQLDPVTRVCSVVKASTVPPYQDAPVLPHVVQQFPLGPFDCPWG